MIALMAALLMQATTMPAWMDGRTSDGWQYLGKSASLDSLMLTKPGPRPGMIWVRSEREKMQEGALSYMMLIEADCTGGRYRRVQAIQYAQANLLGPSESFDATTSWSYPGPGTLAEAFFQRGCGLSD